MIVDHLAAMESPGAEPDAGRARFAAMRASSHRRLDKYVLLPLLAAGIGGVAAIAGAVGDQERITDAWYGAEVAADGSVRVTESITYDFGATSRHGIFRDVPGLDPPASAGDIRASSLTAPDQFVLESTTVGGEPATRIRIGDPGRTIMQDHTYLIEYPLPPLFQDGELAWDAHGTYWSVGAEEVEAHVVGANEWRNLRCFTGSPGSLSMCDIDQTEPGHLVATARGLGSGEGLTIYALPDTPLERAPALPEAPTDSEQRGFGILTTGLTGAVVALGATVPVSVWARRRGREEAPIGGPADVAFFDPDELVSSHRRIDAADLEEMATTEFQAPRGISSVVGSIVLDESVGSQIFTAWLLESAIRDEIELIPDPEKKKKATLRRGEAAAPPEVEAILASLFAGRDEVELGTYDKPVGKAATELSSILTDWMPNSGFWNPRGNHRRNKTILFGVLGLVVGLAVLALGGFLAARNANALWVGFVIVGAASAGAAMAALVRSWELKIRSPLGSATWLQVESFRRFLHHSEARHVEIAAGYGMLRQYTAWAVALGETSAWTKAVEAAIRDNPALSSSYAGDLAFASSASSVSSWVSSTSTAPSSSGGGGGGAGGGGGGGGGGSW